MNFVALLLTIIVGLFIFIGSLLGIILKNNKKITDLSISVAFGVIISLLIFEIIPESYEILSDNLGIFRGILSIIVLALIGMVLLKILDLFIPHHTHESHHTHTHKSDKCHNEHLSHIGIVSAIGIIIHNIIEGMSVYLVSRTDIVSGILLLIGVGLHNIPMGLVISSTLINSNYTRKKALNISLIVSISTFIGGIIMFILGSVNEIVEGVLLGITLGMLIYISIFELFHQIYHMKDKKIAKTGILVGIILIIISMFIHNFI